MTHRVLPPTRVLAVIAPVCVAGFAVACAAAISFAVTPHQASTILGLAALLSASTLADRFPVPVEGIDTGGVSLSFVFGVASIVLFGWAAGLIVVCLAPAITQVLERRPALRVAYNVSVVALAATAAGAVSSPINSEGASGVLARVGAAASAQYAVNLLLITAVVAVSARRSLFSLTKTNIRVTIVPFSLMASAALMLVVLWERSPFLSVALVGPLLAIQFYQRAIVGALRAMRLALTDPLTGLGNHRHFHERLEKELQHAQEKRLPLTLCLVDVDDFKRINDRFGHPAGDRVLSRLASRLRQTGEAFGSAATSSRCSFLAMTRTTRSPRRRRSSSGSARWSSSRSARSPSASASRPRPRTQATETSSSASRTARSTGRRSTARTASAPTGRT